MLSTAAAAAVHPAPKAVAAAEKSNRRDDLPSELSQPPVESILSLDNYHLMSHLEIKPTAYQNRTPSLLDL